MHNIIIVRNIKKIVNNIYLLISIVKNDNINFYKFLPFDLLDKINFYKDNKLIRTISSNEYKDIIINNNLNQYWRYNYMLDINELSNYISLKNIYYEIIMEDFNLNNLEDFRLEIKFNNIDNIKIVNHNFDYNQDI